MNFLEYINELNIVSVLIRLLLSLLSGFLIGYERGKHGRAAGARTHILIALGSCMSSIVGIYLISAYHMGDPSRIASGVVSGIGFIGAGIIIVKNNSKVTGLTTAAAMWATGTVGLAFGAGYYLAGLVCTVIIFFTLTILTVFEIKQKKDRRYTMEVDDASRVNSVIDTILSVYPSAHTFDVLPSKTQLENHVCIAVNITDAEGDTEVISILRKIESVIFVFVE